MGKNRALESRQGKERALKARQGADHALKARQDADHALKARQRAMWASGDYHAFATARLWDFGPMLVSACGISPGQRVLDVAAGTGNVAIRAAEAGAVVVASDLTPENFESGRREASAHGVAIEWVEADAEALPFGDSEFDVVTSSVGAIFAPHHRAVADELLRVCRPGGTIGLIALVPTRAAHDMFELMARYAPAPLAEEESPLLWGSEQHVRELFGDRVASLTLERRVFEGNPYADIDFFKAHHPVVVAIYNELADDPERTAMIDRELAELSGRCQREPQELLLIVARN
jgi:2-polyprenyl-3-methyl-5-hydroxy-6-metoxy-1,4-benzoquinol methylase